MSLVKTIQKKTASSKQGAKGIIKGIIACAFQNMAFMLPTTLLYFLVSDMLGGGVQGGRITFYVVGCVICFALIFLTTWFQYNNTYFTTYEESGKRRLSLAERLRKLPLSFFGKRDLADLTSTIMRSDRKEYFAFYPGTVRLVDFNYSYRRRAFRFRLANGSCRALGYSRFGSYRHFKL